MIYKYKCKKHSLVNENGEYLRGECYLGATTFCETCYNGTIRIDWVQQIINKTKLKNEEFEYMGIL